MEKLTLCFDMDGTLADFYGQVGWLADLIAEKTTPYENAKPLFNFSSFARIIHKLQARGYKFAIVSCTSKGGSENFNSRVKTAKEQWLQKHLPSVVWDAIYIIDYECPKVSVISGPSILFDDEERHRKAWQGIAYDEKEILEKLKALLAL